MKLHRFFIDPRLIQGNRIVFSDREIANQLKKVLRIKSGDEVLFLDGSGKEYLTVLDSLDSSGIKGRVVKVSENKNEPELKITLYQSLCKKDKLEWVLQKNTEVGIAAFAPVLAERSEKLGFNAERAEKIIREAAEQSERGILPALFKIQDLSDALKNAAGEKIILDRSGENIKSYKSTVNSQMLNVFVGPEGGFTENEIEIAKNSGVKIISLGPRILRTETAGLVAAAILLNK